MDRLVATAKRLETSFRTGGLTEAINERGLFGAMIDQVPDYLFAKDLQCRFLAVNNAVAQIHGMRAADLVGMSDFDLHPAEAARQFFDIEQSIIQSGKPMIDMEETVRDSTGAKKWLSTSKVPLKDSQGEIVGLIGISRDVTSRKHGDLLREGQTHVLEMIASNVPLGEVLDRLVRLIEGQLDGVMGSILLLDEDGRHLMHGAAPSLPEAYSKAIHGVAIGPAVGSCGTAAYRRQSVIVADIMSDPLWSNYRALASNHGLRSCWSAPILSHLGAVLGTFAMYSSSIRKPDTFELGLIEATTRIAAIAIERKRAADQINFLAHHDALTGLPNRSLLKDRLTQAMLRTGPQNHSVAVVFLDLDHFKTVNDSLGHTGGDELLKIMAGRMVACAGPTEPVIRLGGDEFVILVAYQPDSHNALSAILDRIRAAIADPVLIMGQAVHVTCSMGVATFPADGTDAETLLMNADAAMYRAKEGGRDRFHFYTAEMNVRAHKRLALQEAMRNGIARGEFYLLYQPQIDLSSGRIFAVEALLRWDHPTLGSVPPSEFIPLAEETGLIVLLGDWVLCEACRQARAWQDAGLPNFNVSVNVSARQFHEPDWVTSVKRALVNNRLAPNHLELELTESVLLRDIDLAVITMKDLKTIGVQFAIDDFGTGYSSLSALKTLPVDRLKIDQSFIRNLADDDSDRGIAEAIISLGQRLHMRVIAEGVETERQMEILRESGCDEVQGYFLSRPVSATAIGKLFEQGRMMAEHLHTERKSLGRPVVDHR